MKNNSIEEIDGVGLLPSNAGARSSGAKKSERRLNKNFKHVETNAVFTIDCRIRLKILADNSK